MKMKIKGSMRITFDKCHLNGSVHLRYIFGNKIQTLGRNHQGKKTWTKSEIFCQL